GRPGRGRAAGGVLRAHGPGGGVGARVRVDHQGAGLLGDPGHGHRDTGVHGADDDVDVVALDQLVHVVRGLGRRGLVVDLEVLDLAAAKLAAVLLDIQPEAVLDRFAELGV